MRAGRSVLSLFASVALVVTVTAVPAGAEGAVVPGPDGGDAPPATVAGPTSAQQEAAELLGARVRFSANGHVTTIMGVGGDAVTPPAAGDPAGLAMLFLEANAALFALTADDLGSLYVDRTYETRTADVTHVVVRQRDGDREVFGSTIVLTYASDGALMSVAARYASGAEAPAGARALLGPAAAAEAAAGTVGEVPLRFVAPTLEDATTVFQNPWVEDGYDVTAELVTFQREDGTAVLAYRTFTEVDPLHSYESVVDARTGEVLYQRNTVAFDGPEGRVFTAQHPMITGATRTIVPFTGVNGTWVDGDTTAGNNAIAYVDPDDDETFAASEAPVDADAHFDYPWTDAIFTSGGTDRTTDEDAVVTQAFYYVNFLHDHWYDLGWDEAARNFQEDNFGNGGTGGDRVLVEVDDSFNVVDDDGDPIGCNANFNSGGGDGANGRMQLFVGRASCGNRDMHRAMNGDTVTHEYGHGVSNRLVGDGNLGSGSQTGALGEGWSDALANALWDDPVYGEYNNDNYSTGIRGVAYDTSPLLYSDFDPDNGVHSNGRIWATAMWDARETLVAAYGEGPGSALHEQLLITGMKQTPTSPTYLDARDGYLMADAVENGGDQFCPLWVDFAGMEMGTDAASSGDQDTVTAGTATPAECNPTADAGGPYATDEGAYVMLDATGTTEASDPSAGAHTYAWDYDADGQFDDAVGPTPTFDRVGQDGVRTVSVRVTTAAGTSDTASTTVTIDNVAPAVTVAVDDPEDEGADMTMEFTSTDPGWLDGLAGTVDWGDGVVEPLVGSLENVEPDATFDGTMTHRYGDDGAYAVEVCVSDDDTTTCESTMATILNVDPTVVVDPAQVTTIEEGDVLDVAATFSDPGWLDTYGAEIDWGTPAGDVSVVPAVVTTHGDATRTADLGDVAGSFQYGDDGTFTVTVTVTDDDGGSGSDSFVVTVGNVDPTAEIDLTGTVEWNGQDVFNAHVGEEVPFSARSTDPGSDDLTTTWDWDDGAPSPDSTEVWLVNAPTQDPPHAGDPNWSPSVQPRDVTDDEPHAFAMACVYEVAFTAADDDGGLAADEVLVIIQGDEERTRGPGWWMNQVAAGQRNGNDLTDQEVQCLLDIAGFMSGVFDEVRDASTFAAAHDVLHLAGNTGTESEKLDRLLLARWLDFGAGSLDLAEEVEPGVTWGDLVLQVEAVRLDPTSTTAELRDARQRLQGITG